MEQPQPLSSRSSLSDYQTVIQGPIPLFDTHLRYLSDSYLSFFQERKRIEETYVESLKKLYRKIKSVDASLDDRSELSTARHSWQEVVDNVDRESQARQAFLESLTKQIIVPLTSLKESQERTRKRIKEDIKESTQAYDEYAEIVLPKLKNRYTKKFSEVEDQRRANAPPVGSTQAPSNEPGAYHHNPKPNPLPGSRPTVTSPQPLRALDRRPSGSASAGRNRSPSGSTAQAFSELAHHGKKQLNQLIGGILEKKDGGRESQALRNVRAKREADEADKEYRKGVHWLETLRLRRTKILEGGYKSVELFVEELVTLLKKCLMAYTDNMTATWTTQAQLSTHIRPYIDRISPEKDVLKFRDRIPRSLASAIPDPILYENGLVGSCNDLIFGISLVDYATAKGLVDKEIPKIVRICIAEIDKRGLDHEGIYRVSGRHAVVQALLHDIEKDELEFEFTPKDDIYAVASLLKLYLRELPEPVFKFSLQDRMQHTEDIADHRANNFMLVKSKIRRLPPVHQATLRALLEHLSRVVAHSDKNKMDPKNLAIVFGGVIFGDDEIPKGADLLSVQTWKDTLMEDLITNVNRIFDDQAAHHSPPLPPTPLVDPLPQYYGSKNTKVATVPPPLTIVNNSPGSPQDFTPRLPPRPASSIHPSARANSATSPTIQKSFSEAMPTPLAREREASIDDFSIPPSPSQIGSSTPDLESAQLHTKTASTNDDADAGPPTPPKYPFPSNPTPQGSPRRENGAQAEPNQPAPPAQSAQPVPPAPTTSDDPFR